MSDDKPSLESMRRLEQLAADEGVDRLLADVARLGNEINEVRQCPSAFNDKYITLDSGKREEYESGMVRDLNDGKPRYDLIPIMPLRRVAELYERGAHKYGECNWQLANSEKELQRFKASGLRHYYQYLNGETDEDHAAAVVFNVFAQMFLEAKLASGN